MAGGKGLIHFIASGKILRLVLPPIPRNTGFLRSCPIGFPHAASLSAAQLLHCQSSNILLWKTQLVHLSHYAYMLASVAHQLRLALEQSCSGRERTAVGVIPHAVFSHPHNANAGVPHQFHGAVGHTGAGP